eukprot:6426891-Amphidinium_carterae.1
MEVEHKPSALCLAGFSRGGVGRCWRGLLNIAYLGGELMPTTRLFLLTLKSLLRRNRSTDP